MNPNALIVDASTNTITLPIGGTGSFIANIKTSDGITLDPNSDVVLFALSDPAWIGSKQHNAAILRKLLRIETNESDELYVQVSFVNADTRAMKPGDYVWDLTLITSPEYDIEGYPIVENDSDNVIPIFARSGKLPTFTLRGVSVIV